MKHATTRLAVGLAVLVVCAVAAAPAAAQTGKLTGVVTDAQSGTSLEGAQLILQGTGISALTGSNGRYFIVNVPPTLVVMTKDLYSKSNPDSWYIEIADETGRITRSIAFPNLHNTPLKGVVPSGNATVYIKYFDGIGKFPATVTLQFESVSPPPPPSPPPTILNYPIIVIYSASWATLIAIILVIVWLHRRKHEREEKTAHEKEKEKEKKKVTLNLSKS